MIKAKFKSGFTLVELLIVVAIMLFIAIYMISTINSIHLSDRSSDVQRKKDASRIKVAFEEYFNDNGYYPSSASIRNLNCGEAFASYLSSWPCDPDGHNYIILVGPNQNQPTWFRVLVNLRNREDEDIPPNWYSNSAHYVVGDGSVGINQANYGVSSPNVSWFERTVPASCQSNNINANCYIKGFEVNSCKMAIDKGCRGDNCYTNSECDLACQVDCCGDSCN